ncbi:hypothetical protein [Paenibacillus ginsengihumi]|uniref:hypothetical protein n=1 Tax=Paenibacillus ginsengihumi TaxID=431596 RepID=UPI00037A2C43|nr:hypothetical protein [Paenibacillus ginsengihumi]
MATRQLQIDNSFSGTKDTPVKVHTWDVWREDDKIICYSHSGAARKRKFVFNFEPGTIGLFNGISDAYAYFRKASFQQFLDRHELTAVKKGNPNQEYCLRDSWTTEGREWFEITTDGEILITYDSYGRTLDWIRNGWSSYEWSYTFEVENATYVIIKKPYSKIIYTSVKDVTTLDIDAMEVSLDSDKLTKEYLWALRRSFTDRVIYK